MTFDVAATAYDRFMGRWSSPLAAEFVDLAGVGPGQRVLDVGCGPGALTARLVDRVGAAGVTAVDPSAPFVAALAERLPGVEVHRAAAEALPFEDDGYDVALAQLVVQFMSDPVAGLAEMARVVRPGGTVAACIWDHAGDRGPLAVFYRAQRELHPEVPDESTRPGVREGHLGELLAAAGLRDVHEGSLTVHLRLAGFEEWWAPFELGVGPAGDLVARLGDDERQRLRERCAELLPATPLELSGTAWTARGSVGGAP